MPVPHICLSPFGSSLVENPPHLSGGSIDTRPNAAIIVFIYRAIFIPHTITPPTTAPRCPQISGTPSRGILHDGEDHILTVDPPG